MSVCSRSSWPPPSPAPRCRPTASISSTKMMHGACALPCSNRSRTRDAPTPTNISTKSEPDIWKKGRAASPATARARSVLPVPGGPTRRTPFGSRPPSREKRDGSFRNSMISSSSTLASSAPATSLKSTWGMSGVIMRALERPNWKARFPPDCIARKIHTQKAMKRNTGRIEIMSVPQPSPPGRASTSTPCTRRRSVRAPGDLRRRELGGELVDVGLFDRDRVPELSLDPRIAVEGHFEDVVGLDLAVELRVVDLADRAAVAAPELEGEHGHEREQEPDGRRARKPLRPGGSVRACWAVQTWFLALAGF